MLHIAIYKWGEAICVEVLPLYIHGFCIYAVLTDEVSDQAKQSRSKPAN